MVYVKRDGEGRIVAVSLEPIEGMEVISASSEELLPFIKDLSGGGGLFESSDQRLIRVLEDVIDLLMQREVIRFTDLPDAAQQKLLERRNLRQEIQALNLLGNPNDTI